jgi:hypothetical protein
MDSLIEPATTHSESGVDVTLIRWMLSLTPDDRLNVLEEFINTVEEIRRGSPAI